MIVCRSCGSQNADTDDFCGSCGEFLEWTGEKVLPTPAKPAEGPAATSSVGPPEAPLPSKDESAPPGATALVAPIPPGTPSDRADEPGPGPTPVPEPAQRQAQPAALMPQQQARKRRPAAELRAPPTRQLRPDDLICGDCGEGNPPTRRFCSRCGASLQTATVVPTPWWRRLLQRIRQRPARRPPRWRSGRGLASTLRGLFVAVRRVLLGALLLAGLLYAIFPPLRHSVNEQVLGIKRQVESMIFTQYAPVRPTSVTATAELPEHPAGAATDGFTNTFWVAPDAAAQPTLVLAFDRPTRLARAIIRVGGGEDFQALGRPERLHLVYSTGRTADVTLLDTPEPQEVEFGGGDGANAVEVHIVSTYRSVQNAGVAVTEIELFERK